jgi:hypothetical protein
MVMDDLDAYLGRQSHLGETADELAFGEDFDQGDGLATAYRGQGEGRLGRIHVNFQNSCGDQRLQNHDCQNRCVGVYLFPTGNNATSIEGCFLDFKGSAGRILAERALAALCRSVNRC